jgi:hypothetical protein
MKLLTLLLVFSGILYSHSYSQYQTVGNATSLTPTTFLLTPDIAWQSGAVWHKLKHDFNTPFSVTGSLFLGDADDGADGIVFVIQNKCFAVATAGGGLGYQNFPGYSLGVEFDTYQNGGAPVNDPAYDHLAIFRDGSINHTTNLAGPVQMDATLANTEDNNWHSYQIDYNPSTTTLNIYFGGNLRLSYNIDIVNNILHGENDAYWGFTSATGGTSAENKVAISSVIARTLNDATICNSTHNVSLAPLDAVNVATNHTAVASSVEGGFVAANAFDNNSNTRWSSNFSDPQWISVDLGTPADIDSVIMYWEGAYGSEYIIQTSANNATWTDQYHEYTGNGGTDKIYFSASNVRYVRMYGLHRGTGYGYSLWEFEVYSTPHYTWSPNDGSISDINSANPVFSPTTTTTYSVTIPDACLGQTTLSYTITVDCSTPLPVELISFDGMLNNRQIDLFWATANEVNNDYFDIERSVDAANWNTIGHADGAGTHNGVLSYTMTDENLDWTLPGYYYRLTQVDFDGHSSVSDVIFIPLKPDFSDELLIFPSPVVTEREIHIVGINSEIDVLSISDVSGKNVLSDISVIKMSKDHLLVDVSQLAAGCYIVLCGKQQGKFMK